MTEQEAKAVIAQLTYEEKLALRSLLMSLDRARGKELDPCIHKGAGYRVIHEAGEAFGLDNLGTHTMRKTFGYHFYLQTKDVVLLMRIFNHAHQSETLRYIGIEQTSINAAMRKFSYS